MSSPVRRLTLHALAVAFCTAAWLAPGAAAVRGEDWMFRPSYHSHSDPGVPPGTHSLYGTPLPQHRAGYRPAWYGVYPGFAARGGYRFNAINLRSGSSSDTTIIREGWLEIRP